MKRFYLTTLALACAVTITACSGSSKSGTPANGGGPPPVPTSSPTSAPITTFAFHIIGPDSSRRAGVAAAGSTVTLPAGYTYGGPIANAILTYPDGSSQQADANGVFTSAKSNYAATYAITLGIRAVEQPVLKIMDPSGGSSAGIGIVTPFASSAGGAPIGGVTVLPHAAMLFPGELVTLLAVGTDAADNISALDSAQIVWSSSAGAAITPIAGTNQATYLAPSTAGTQIDVVTATVHSPGNPVTFVSTSSITTIAKAAAFSVSGTLATASGASIPGGSALFVLDDPPRVYPSFNFAAVADASGNYQRNLPANAEFQLAISVPAGSAPVSAQSLYPAVANPGASATLETGSAGASEIANLQIGSTGEFDDQKDDAKNAIPDPVVSTRDAWFAEELTRTYPFWADSGVLGVLAGSHVDGAAPKPVGSGLLARWCYQWQARTGGDTLVLIENAAPACTAPGNDAFEIAAQSPNTFSIVQYRHISGPYALSGTLNDSGSAVLVAAGTWNQSLTSSGGTITGDAAKITLDLYGPVTQTLGKPVSHLSLQYGYSLAAGLGTVSLSNATLSDAATGLVLATASGSLTGSAPAASCVGTPSACYAGSTAITRNYSVNGLSATHGFSTRDTIAGDGSATHTVTSTAAGDASVINFPIASAAARAGGSCIVCAGSAGSLLDVDGATQLGAFTIPAAQGVSFNLLDTAAGQAPGTPVASINFPL